MLVDRRLSTDIRFIVEYFDIPMMVDYRINVGTTHESTRAYSYHEDIETSILAAYKRTNNVK